MKSYAPTGLMCGRRFSHGLRDGLKSFAATRLIPLALIVTYGVASVSAQTAPATQPLLPIPRTERLPRSETRRIGPAVNAATRPTSRPAPPPFIIAIWYPPAVSMPLWKARGVNTVIGYEHQSNRVSMDEWTEAAVGNRMFMIRQPRANPADDLKEPYLLGWMHVDEPDLKRVEPSVLADEYAEWKKAAPELPVFLSVSGGGILFRKTPRVVYEQYFETADWIANDFYPITGWNQPTWIPRLGEAVELCRKHSGGKPQFAFIETSSQQLAWNPKETRGVTPDELRAEIWHAVIHGVKGIIYFPQQFNPFVYDATPSPVSVEMASQNRLLTKLAPVLALPVNPKELTVSVTAPLEVTWRKDNEGQIHVIVLNLSDKSAKSASFRLIDPNHKSTHFTIQGDDMLIQSGNDFTLNLSPFEVRIFVVKEVKSTR